MPQINLNVTPQFAEDLERLVRLRGLPNRSQAIRVAVREAVERALAEAPAGGIASLQGIAVQGARRRRRFTDDDGLWEAK